ncbi:hypothetical protein QQZ08_004612 [Neonectria magnoliae]|uniref:Uncharacterized protein n=1 Tax=Neonectria magnoliae TaxID=2732573 RepID=A0ABR1I7C4_9HYPO
MLSQLNLCHATLEQTLFILPPESTLANKIQSFVNEIRCRVLATMTSETVSDSDVSIQPSPLPRSTQNGLFTPSSPTSHKCQHNVDLSPSDIDPLPFNLSHKNDHDAPSSPTQSIMLNDEQQSNVELPSTPLGQKLSPLNTELNIPFALRQNTRKHNRTEGSDVSTPLKRQRRSTIYPDLEQDGKSPRS